MCVDVCGDACVLGSEFWFRMLMSMLNLNQDRKIKFEEMEKMDGFLGESLWCWRFLCCSLHFISKMREGLRESADLGNNAKWQTRLNDCSRGT
jgi:hypothetical protein